MKKPDCQQRKKTADAGIPLRQRVWFLCLIMIPAVLIGSGHAYSEMADTAGKLTVDEQRILYQAQQLISGQQDNQAEKLLNRYVGEQNGNVHYLLLFTLGNAMARQGKNNEALANYDLAVRINAKDADVWRNMGKICFDLKQYGRAAGHLFKAYELMTEKEPEILYQAAVCRMLNNTPDKAVALLEKVCDWPEKEVKDEWLGSLANAYIETGQWAKAAATVQRIIRKESDNPHWWKVLAQVYLGRKDYRNAAAALQIHLDLSADGGKTEKEDLVLLADLYRLANVPLKAARLYEQIVSLSERPDDYEKVAAAYLSAHQPDQAEKWLRRGLDQKPDSRLWRMLGILFYNRGQYAEAYEVLARSRELNPDDGQTSMLMGYCALQLERYEKAAAAFQSAARSRPHRETAEKALAQLDRFR